MQHDFADGKYTVINDNGKLTALRYGEPWARDLTGDNLIYSMLVEVDRLKQELKQELFLRSLEIGNKGVNNER
jgi:hypothetical protein